MGEHGGGAGERQAQDVVPRAGRTLLSPPALCVMGTFLSCAGWAGKCGVFQCIPGISVQAGGA